jgi:hypothetical protein
MSVRPCVVGAFLDNRRDRFGRKSGEVVELAKEHIDANIQDGLGSQDSVKAEAI